MNDELLRLSSFSSWPATAKASPVRLAKAGLYFNGHGDTAVCFRCSTLFENWKEWDDPLERHRRLSANCPVVTGNEVNNIPLRLYTNPNISGAPDPDPCDVGLDQTDYAESEPIPLRGLLSVYNCAFGRARRHGLFSTTSSIFIDRTNPDFDRLRSEKVRLSTFHDWPPTAHAQPAELVREGFFFTGLNDRVQCAFCRGFLRNWVSGDKPAEEHQKHFPECLFVRGQTDVNICSSVERQHTLVGNIFINEFAFH